MNNKKSIQKDERTRNWSFIVYPIEGNPPAPSNWREMLDEEHIQWIESPLHDKDLNPDGTPKKPHIHVIVLFEGNKSFEQIKEMTDKLNAPIPQKCVSVKGLVRYMAHLDNPDKVQYLTNDIIGHGGVDVLEYLKPSTSNRHSLINEMMQHVEDNNIIEFVDLLNYARIERFDDWFSLLCDNSAYIMEAMIKSRRYRANGNTKVIKVNSDTGEIQ